MAWKDGFQGTPTGWDYVGRVGGATLGAAFATLFWPRFIEARGCVLLRERYDASAFEAWWERLNGDKPQIEAVVNHVHLWDVFDPNAEHVPGEVLEALTAVIASGWEGALRDAYPDRQFRVEIVPDDYGPTLTFSSRGG